MFRYLCTSQTPPLQNEKLIKTHHCQKCHGNEYYRCPWVSQWEIKSSKRTFAIETNFKNEHHKKIPRSLVASSKCTGFGWVQMSILIIDKNPPFCPFIIPQKLGEKKQHALMTLISTFSQFHFYLFSRIRCTDLCLSVPPPLPAPRPAVPHPRLIMVAKYAPRTDGFQNMKPKAIANVWRNTDVAQIRVP